MNDVLNIFMQKYNLQLAGCRDSGIINGVNGWSVYWSSSLFDRDYYVWDFLMNDM